MNNRLGKGKKVFVGLSGGVDSSVSAALLKEAGYDVTGVFIKVWHPDFLSCTWKDEKRDAMRVCAKLNIPFLLCNAEKEYKEGVVDYMINEYKAGRTPNPDVMCNKEVKFGVFLRFALEHGADYVATGHYAQVREENGFFRLYKGADANKDQSYFLWTLKQDQLKHTLFPVGHLPKPEVRKLAEKYDLHTSDKKDSQGLCFIGKVDMKEFLKRYIPAQQGNVLNENGEVIGTHDGAMYFTMGERHGFLITKKGNADKPYYVIGKDLEANTITVSNKDKEENESYISSAITLEQFNKISDLKYEAQCDVRMRYRQPLVQAIVKQNDSIEVLFNEPQEDITLGQSLVAYIGDECVGGGIINSRRNSVREV